MVKRIWLEEYRDDLLKLVEERGEVNVAELSNTLHISMNDVRRLLDKEVGRGYIRVRRESDIFGSYPVYRKGRRGS